VVDIDLSGVSDVINAIKKRNANSDSLSIAIEDIYTNEGKNWYQTYPYVFSIIDLSDKNQQNFHYALPIPPESISTQMVAPSDAVPTLGGVVEEPSAAVFWNIMLAGTTGMGVGRDTQGAIGYAGTTANVPASVFRDVIPKTGIATSLMLSLSRAASYATGLVDAPTEAFRDAQAGFGAAAAASRTAEYLIQPHMPYSYSAVAPDSNGYTEIHRLHKFFILYTHLNSRRDNATKSIDVSEFKKKRFALFFKNYKDNQMFRIVLKNFSMTKSVNSPFLYRYQIQLKGWDIQTPDDSSVLGGATDRFKGDLASVSTITATSAVTKAKNVMRAFNSAKTDPLGTFLSIPPVV